MLDWVPAWTSSSTASTRGPAWVPAWRSSAACAPSCRSPSWRCTRASSSSAPRSSTTPVRVPREDLGHRPAVRPGDHRTGHGQDARSDRHPRPDHAAHQHRLRRTGVRRGHGSRRLDRHASSARSSACSSPAWPTTPFAPSARTADADQRPRRPAQPLRGLSSSWSAPCSSCSCPSSARCWRCFLFLFVYRLRQRRKRKHKGLRILKRLSAGGR